MDAQPAAGQHRRAIYVSETPGSGASPPRSSPRDPREKPRSRTTRRAATGSKRRLSFGAAAFSVIVPLADTGVKKRGAVWEMQ